MPYTEHESCKMPEDLTQQVWRYMDFTKFVAMLENQALFFPNLTNLQGDPLEGFLTKPTVEQFRKVPDESETIKAGISIEGCHVDPDPFNLRGHLALGIMRSLRNFLYVSSWHMSDHESAAMWKLYLKNGEGVAIQSTVGRLIESLKRVKGKVFVGMVEYVDYEKDRIPDPTNLSAAMHKRKIFEHEKELRTIFVDERNIEGLPLPVDIDVLIEKVFVAPTSPKWIYDLLIKVIARYGLNKEVVKPTLEQSPLY